MNCGANENHAPEVCRQCRFKSYDDGETIYCGFCMRRILIELGYLNDKNNDEAEDDPASEYMTGVT